MEDAQSINKYLRGVILDRYPELKNAKAEDIYRLVIEQNQIKTLLTRLTCHIKKNVVRYLVYWHISQTREYKASRQSVVCWSESEGSQVIFWKEMCYLELAKHDDQHLLTFNRDWRRLYKWLSKSSTGKITNPNRLKPLTLNNDIIRRSYVSTRFHIVKKESSKVQVTWAMIVMFISKKWVDGDIDRHNCGRNSSIKLNWAEDSANYLINVLKYAPSMEEKQIIDDFIMKSDHRCKEISYNTISHKKQKIRKVVGRKFDKRLKCTEKYKEITDTKKAPEAFVNLCLSSTFPFVIENPQNYLRHQSFMKPLMDSVWNVSMCMFGKKYTKPSTLYNNLNLHNTYGKMICGSNGCMCPELKRTKLTTHEARIGQAENISHGDDELKIRCEIPKELSSLCLAEALSRFGDKKVKKRKFMIDICCGWQSVKEAVSGHDILYIGIDVDHVKYSKGDDIKTDFVADLSEVSPSMYDIVYTICDKYELCIEDLVLIWASPPCTTYTHLMNVNRSKGSKSHRVLDVDDQNYLKPLLGIEGDLARRHDNIIKNILRFLNISDTDLPIAYDTANKDIQFLENLSKSKEAQAGLSQFIHICKQAGTNISIDFGPVKVT